MPCAHVVWAPQLIYQWQSREWTSPAAARSNTRLKRQAGSRGPCQQARTFMALSSAPIGPIVNFLLPCFTGSRALHKQIFRSISRKKIFGKNSPGGPTPTFFRSDFSSSIAIRLTNLVLIACKTVACRRVRTFKKRKSCTFGVQPWSPGGPAPKIFFAYFSWVVWVMTHANFQNQYLEKKFWKKFSAGGPTPKFFWKVTVSPLGWCACKISSW